MSVAETSARSSVVLIKLVIRPAPFHCTADATMKLEPLTVNVNAVPPGATIAGDTDAIAGAGLSPVVVLPLEQPVARQAISGTKEAGFRRTDGM